MGRPSKKAERAELILDAFERCVARYGVDGATLEKIAEESGLARPLIRHNVGNKDELLNSLVTRYLTQSDELTQQLIDAVPHELEGTAKAKQLIEILFDPQYSDGHVVRVASALIMAGSTRPELAAQMQRWTHDFIAKIAVELAAAYPTAKLEAVQATAAGVSGIYFNVEALTPLISDETDASRLAEFAALRQASLSAANTLLGSLG